MAREKQLSQRLARILPLIGVILGMTLVFAGVVLYFEHAITRGGVVSVGMLLLAVSAWYSDNPFFKKKRRYLRLRTGVDSFIVFVRELNAAGGAPEPQGELDRLNAAMHESVDRMAQLAGKPDAGSL